MSIRQHLLKICAVPPCFEGEIILSQIQKLRCDKQAGRMMPIIDRGRCEAKADCVSICPYQVFEIHTLTTAERKGLSVPGRLKVLVHGGKQAFAVRADACRACGLCVRACPEQAIALVPAARASSSSSSENRKEEV
jgi:4Fe-4S ferredoxin